MSQSLSTDSTISHYRIVSKLGAGGMGEVYLAQDTSELGRRVALKILTEEVARNKNRLQRFTREARTVSNLNHPNILTIHEFGQTDSLSYIASEFVDGVTLRKHLANRRLKVVELLLGLGDKEQTFVWLEKGFEDRSGQLGRTRWEPPFVSLRTDPRLLDLFKRMGLPG